MRSNIYSFGPLSPQRIPHQFPHSFVQAAQQTNGTVSKIANSLYRFCTTVKVLLEATADGKVLLEDVLSSQRTDV
jgi:hypothetical protein